MLYTETDLEESMDKIETINFHEVKEVAGIKFWCYHAGHVLGAAMFMIEIAGVKVRSSLDPFSPFFPFSPRSGVETSLKRAKASHCRYSSKFPSGAGSVRLRGLQKTDKGKTIFAAASV